jgi:soluble P-type ATPase
MLALDIPGFGELRLEHLALDFNGTLAEDGRLLEGVAPLLRELATSLAIHVVTADTVGHAAEELAGLPLRLTIIGEIAQADAKLAFVRNVGPSSTVAIGNGRNDRKMLDAAALGIAVVQREGAAQAALKSADIVATGIVEALQLLLHPLRLVATLRA